MSLLRVISPEDSNTSNFSLKLNSPAVIPANGRIGLQQFSLEPFPDRIVLDVSGVLSYAITTTLAGATESEFSNHEVTMPAGTYTFRQFCSSLNSEFNKKLDVSVSLEDGSEIFADIVDGRLVIKCSMNQSIDGPETSDFKTAGYSYDDNPAPDYGSLTKIIDGSANFTGTPAYTTTPICRGSGTISFTDNHNYLAAGTWSGSPAYVWTSTDPLTEADSGLEVNQDVQFSSGLNKRILSLADDGSGHLQVAVQDPPSTADPDSISLNNSGCWIVGIADPTELQSAIDDGSEIWTSLKYGIISLGSSYNGDLANYMDDIANPTLYIKDGDPEVYPLEIYQYADDDPVYTITLSEGSISFTHNGTAVNLPWSTELPYGDYVLVMMAIEDATILDGITWKKSEFAIIKEPTPSLGVGPSAYFSLKIPDPQLYSDLGLTREITSSNNILYQPNNIGTITAKNNVRLLEIDGNSIAVCLNLPIETNDCGNNRTAVAFIPVSPDETFISAQPNPIPYIALNNVSPINLSKINVQLLGQNGDFIGDALSCALVLHII